VISIAVAMLESQRMRKRSETEEETERAPLSKNCPLRLPDVRCGKADESLEGVPWRTLI